MNGPRRPVTPGTFRAALLLGVFLFAPASSATVMVQLSLEDMAERSSVVVRGRVIGGTSAWDEAHRRIDTYTEIEVLERIHAGSSVLNTVVVRSMGGEVGDVGMKVSGAPRFIAGEEVVLFLRADPLDASRYQVVGMSQGKFRLEREAKGRVIAVPEAEGLAFVRRDGEGALKVDPAVPRLEAIPLEDLRRRVRAAIERNAPSPAGTSVRVPRPAAPASVEPAPR